MTRPRALITNIGSFDKDGAPFDWLFWGNVDAMTGQKFEDIVIPWESYDGYDGSRLFAGWRQDELRAVWAYIYRN